MPRPLVAYRRAAIDPKRRSRRWRPADNKC